MRWANREESDGALVGQGHYGQVYKRDDGSVVKVVENVKRTGGSAKLAYREHVMSFLQTVLVIRGHCAHLPMHYGFASAPNHVGISMRMYIEAFDCSVDAAPKGRIETLKDWSALMFHVLSAIVCVARLLEVCHNDVYPRNVLLKLEPSRTHYDHFGTEHRVAWHSLAVLTDFGVCSSPLLASKLGPEVKRTPAIPRDPAAPYGSIAPSAHVLNYTFLPPFSRDPYCLFKWGVFRSKGLPAAPSSAASACQEALRYIDAHQDSFARKGASLHLLKHVFRPERPMGRALLESGDGPFERFCVQDQDRADVLRESTSLLESAETARSPRRPPEDDAPVVGSAEKRLEQHHNDDAAA